MDPPDGLVNRFSAKNRWSAGSLMSPQAVSCVAARCGATLDAEASMMEAAVCGEYNAHPNMCTDIRHIYIYISTASSSSSFDIKSECHIHKTIFVSSIFSYFQKRVDFLNTNIKQYNIYCIIYIYIHSFVNYK